MLLEEATAWIRKKCISGYPRAIPEASPEFLSPGCSVAYRICKAFLGAFPEVIPGRSWSRLPLGSEKMSFWVSQGYPRGLA